MGYNMEDIDFTDTESVTVTPAFYVVVQDVGERAAVFSFSWVETFCERFSPGAPWGFC